MVPWREVCRDLEPLRLDEPDRERLRALPLDPSASPAHAVGTEAADPGQRRSIIRRRTGMDSPDAVPLLLAHYRRAFDRSPRAQDAARRLGLGDPTQWRALPIGFVDRTAGPALAPRGAADARRIRRAWTDAGLLRPDGRERFSGCLVIPILDDEGRLVQCAARPVTVHRGRARAASIVLPRPAAVRAVASVEGRAEITLCLDAFDAARLAFEGAPRVFAVVGPFDPGVLDEAPLGPVLGQVLHVRLAVSGTRAGADDAARIAAALAGRALAISRVPAPLGEGPSMRDRPCDGPRSRESTDVHALSVRALGAGPEPLRTQVLDWLGRLAREGRRTTTLISRAWELRPFVRFLAARGLRDVRRLTPAVVVAYADTLRGAPARPRAPGTQRKLCTALRLLLRHTLGRHARCAALEAALPRIPAHSPPVPRAMSEAAVRQVLRSAGPGEARQLLDRALIAVLYATALRRAELVGLDLGDLDAETGLVRVRDGKGGRSRVVPLGAATDAVLAYAERVRAADTRGLAQPALFVDARGHRLSGKRLTARLGLLVRRSGAAARGSCHIFRHSAATHMHDRGADIRDLQVYLGHASLTSTQIYTAVSSRRVQAVHRATHPLGDRDGEAWFASATPAREVGDGDE